MNTLGDPRDYIKTKISFQHLRMGTSHSKVFKKEARVCIYIYIYIYISPAPLKITLNFGRFCSRFRPPFPEVLFWMVKWWAGGFKRKNGMFQVCCLMMFKRTYCRWLECEPTGRVHFNFHLKWGASLWGASLTSFSWQKVGMCIANNESIFHL